MNDIEILQQEVRRTCRQLDEMADRIRAFTWAHDHRTPGDRQTQRYSWDRLADEEYAE